MVGVVRLSCPYAYMVKTTRLKAVETCTSNGFTRKNRNENPKPRKWGRTIMTPAALNNGRLDMKNMNEKDRYKIAFDMAVHMLNTHPHLEITSALKEAGAQLGIAWGDDMGNFVIWSRKRLGISRELY